MYGKFTTGTGTGGAVLALTGTTMNSLALIVAGTTLIAATLAMWKLIPRFTRKR